MDRLGAQDLMMVWPEEAGWSQDIGALAIIDGRTLLDADGRFRIETVRDEVGRRLHLVPRFRQLLCRPRFGLGWPLWIDAPAVDIADHVRVLELDQPADEGNLLLACERLRSRRWNWSRPLWEMWFLPGLPHGRVGFFIRVHHAIADGVAGIAVLGAFVDPVPNQPRVRVPQWTPAARPSAWSLFDDNVRRRAQQLRQTVKNLLHLPDTIRRARRAWPAVREAFVEGRAPRTSLNRRVGWDRRFALIRSDLDQLKRVAHAHGAKVNDVLMAVVASGLRALLLSRGESVDGIVLRAFVPVSLHGEQSGDAQGNLDGAMVVPLPVGEPDDLRRLKLIAAETAVRKKKSRPQGGALFRNIPIQRAWLHFASRQRLTNTYAANVPGLPVPVYLAGSRLLELFPIVPLIGNVSIGVGALSYAGQFNITLVADRDLCPDLDVVVDGARRSLAMLANGVPERSLSRIAVG
jgi:WS/DGAT/MGAT family acyltransferase